MSRKEEILHQQISEAWNNSHRPGSPDYHQFQRLICNWTNSETGKSGNKARTMGVKRGIADWLYLGSGGKSVWVELKTEEGSQSPEQVKFELLCASIGHEYHICRSYSEFWSILAIPEPFPVSKLLTR